MYTTGLWQHFSAPLFPSTACICLRNSSVCGKLPLVIEIKDENWCLLSHPPLQLGNMTWAQPSRHTYLGQSFSTSVLWQSGRPWIDHRKAEIGNSSVLGNVWQSLGWSKLLDMSPLTAAPSCTQCIVKVQFSVVLWHEKLGGTGLGNWTGSLEGSLHCCCKMSHSGLPWAKCSLLGPLLWRCSPFLQLIFKNFNRSIFCLNQSAFCNSYTITATATVITQKP